MSAHVFTGADDIVRACTHLTSAPRSCHLVPNLGSDRKRSCGARIDTEAHSTEKWNPMKTHSRNPEPDEPYGSKSCGDVGEFLDVLIAINLILLTGQQHIEEVLEHWHGMKHENFGLKIIWPKIAHPAQRLSSVLKAASGGGDLGNTSSDRPGVADLQRKLNTTEKQGVAKATPAYDQDNNITTHLLKKQVADLQARTQHVPTHAADGTRPVPTRSYRVNASRQHSRQQQEHHTHS